MAELFFIELADINLADINACFPRHLEDAGCCRRPVTLDKIT